MRPEDQLQGQTIQTVGTGNETVREQDKIHLVLSYLAPLSLIPLLTVKDSEYVKWHAKNGLVLGIGGSIAVAIIGAIPVIGIFSCLALVALIVVDVLAMVKSLRGERWRIPGVTELAEKL